MQSWAAEPCLVAPLLGSCMLFCAVGVAHHVPPCKQLLLALFHCYRTHPAALQVDTNEIEDARWFHTDYLAAQLHAAISGSSPPSALRGAASAAASEAPFRIPGPYALANRIISSWLHEQQQRRTLQGGSAEEAAAAAALAAVPDVCIDEGSFKYVLLRLSTADGEAGHGGCSGGAGCMAFLENCWFVALPGLPCERRDSGSLLPCRPAQQAGGAWGHPCGIPQPRDAALCGGSAGACTGCRPEAGNAG